MAASDRSEPSHRAMLRHVLLMGMEHVPPPPGKAEFDDRPLGRTEHHQVGGLVRREPGSAPIDLERLGMEVERSHRLIHDHVQQIDPDQLARSYEACLEGQLAGLEETRAGRLGRDVDAVARRVIEQAGFGELFAHGLGHGVGMEIHEQPAMRPESEDVLAADGVVTVEPGIYHPGLGGIRIEDLVIIRNNGPEVLTTFTKELVTVG